MAKLSLKQMSQELTETMAIDILVKVCHEINQEDLSLVQGGILPTTLFLLDDNNLEIYRTKCESQYHRKYCNNYLSFPLRPHDQASLIR